MARAEHWDRVYGTRRADEVSWFQRRPTTSLEIIEGLALVPGAAIVDVGGGTSSLVDELLAAGFADITVLDVSEIALATARARLAGTPGRGEVGPAAEDTVRWVCEDVCRWEPKRRFDLWHDRAVFHFLVDENDRDRYRVTMARALRPGGHAVVATFAADGPETCSGLPVVRYDAAALAATLAPGFELVDARREMHATPSGAVQPFTWVVLRRVTDPGTDPQPPGGNA